MLHFPQTGNKHNLTFLLTSLYVNQIVKMLTSYEDKSAITRQLNAQVAQLSHRDRAAGWVSNGQKWKTGTKRQYIRTI